LESQNLPQKIVDEAFRHFTPPPDVTVTEWAEENRVLSPENCALPGPYRVSVTPYLKEILDCITDRSIEKIACQKSAQVAWTDGIINNALGYYIAVDPSPIIILFPTDSMAQRYSKEKLSPMIRDASCLKRLISNSTTRESGNTIHSKNFTGGHLELVGSNSPTNMASSPIRIILVEEPDRCASNSGGEGSALKLVYERGKTFSRRKILVGGSPTIAGASEIEREMSLSDKRRFMIFCPDPDCNEPHELRFENVVWDKEAPEKDTIFGYEQPRSARFKCPCCGKHYSNAQKNRQLQTGYWQSTEPFKGTAGFYISELMSPFPNATVVHVVEKFLEAQYYLEKGDPTFMITFRNTSLGETWDENISDQVDWEKLRDRGEAYTLYNIPSKKVLLVTAGVDVQIDRLSVVIAGYGRGEESWRILWLELIGDPFQQDVWEELDELINHEFDHPLGGKIKISSVAVDSGGKHTQMVYNYVRRRPKCMAIKGMSTRGKPIVGRPSDQEVIFNGRKIKNGVKLWPLGVDTTKYHIMSRLAITKPGPAYWHFSNDLPDEYYEQLTNERLVMEFKGGKVEEIWKAFGRNEAFDCEVYAYSAAIRIGLATKNWDNIEDSLIELPSYTEKSETKVAPPQVNRTSSSKFIGNRNGWFKRR